MGIDIRQDDLSSVEVQSLIAEHLSGMHSNSPPGHVHALAIERLRGKMLPSGLRGRLVSCMGAEH